MSLEPRVDKLEEYVLAMSVGINTLTSEMKEFKDEMKEFKDEMKEFKDEMKEFKDEMNIKWGNLANQLGRVVEDLIIPNINSIVSDYFEETVNDYFEFVYKRKSDSSKGREFDGIVTTSSYVFLFEVKNNISQEDVDDFQKFVQSDEFFDYFQEYSAKKLVPIMGSINLKEHQVKLLTDANILALSIKGDILTLANFDDLKDTI